MTVFTDTFVTRYYEITGFCPTEKLFVMTDLHGCSQAMSRLLKHYDGRSMVVFLGDAIDRGPDSYGVIKKLLELDAICILGNHEFLSLEELYPETVHDKNFVPLWTNCNGGDKTLDSFESAINNGAEYIENKNKIKLPKIYDDYIKRCQSHYLCGNILFTHSGIPPHDEVKFYEDPFDIKNFDDTFLWWRPRSSSEMYAEKPRVFNGKEVFSVSGHTPTNPAYVRQNFGIHLDTGHTIKLALEIEPASDGKACRYRIFGTNCYEVYPDESLSSGRYSEEFVLKQEKECIEENIILKLI